MSHFDIDDPRLTEEYWLKHIRYLEASVWLFSHQGKAEREVYVCDAFLRNLNVRFDPSELRAEPKQDEPIDVHFRDASFQVKEIKDDRPRHREAKESLALAKRALEAVRAGKQPPSLARPWKNPEPIAFDQFAAMVGARAAHEATKPKAMAPAVRREVDLLFYVNAADKKFMLPPEGRYRGESFESLGWRSISFVHAFFSCVLSAAPSAPAIFRDNSGRCYATDPAKWFEEQ